MKKIICLLLVTILVSGCGNSSVEKEIIVDKVGKSVVETDDNSIKELSNESEDIEEKEGIQVNDGLLTVEITLSSDLVGDTTQEEINDVAEEAGFLSATLNEDGSVTYKMTKNKQQEILTEIRIQLTDFSKYIGTDGYENITDITANDDMTEFIVYTKSKELTIDENLLSINLSISSAIYSAFSGNTEDSISVIYMNPDTNEVIEEMNSNQ